MIRIDLAKDRLSSKESRTPLRRVQSSLFFRTIEKLGRWTTVIAWVALAVLPYLFLGQYKTYVINRHETKMAQMKNEVGEIKIEIEKMAPFKKELDSYEAQERLVRNRLESVQKLVESRMTPVFSLDSVGQNLSKNAWLNSIEYKNQDGSTQIALQGMGVVNQDTTDFMDKLIQSTHFDRVQLDGVSAATFNRNEVRNFLINIFVRREPAAAEETLKPKN